MDILPLLQYRFYRYWSSATSAKWPVGGSCSLRESEARMGGMDGAEVTLDLPEGSVESHLRFPTSRSGHWRMAKEVTHGVDDS